MRILFLTHGYPPHDLGGLTLRCQETVNAMRARGHACHVLTSRYGVDEGSRAQEGITRSLYFQANVNHYQPLDFFLRRPWQEQANRSALRHALDAFQPEVAFVWGLWNLSRGLPYLAEQWMSSERVAYSIADYWPMEPDIHETYWCLPAQRACTEALKRPIRRVALRMLARDKRAQPLVLQNVVCVSQYVRHKLSEAGALPHGARVIYNGIDPQPFLEAANMRAASQDTASLVYVGGLAKHKGVHTAIKAISLLKSQGKADGLHLTIIGSGHPDYEELLKQHVGVLGLAKNVLFRGRVPRSKIAEILADQDIFLFTSVYEEPMARTVMEAMAVGLPVIGTAVGGQREMLEDGVNALTFQPDNVADLADRIVQLACDPALRARLADAGRQTVLERFTLERMVDEMEKWLETIVAGGAT